MHQEDYNIKKELITKYNEQFNELQMCNSKLKIRENQLEENSKTIMSLNNEIKHIIEEKEIIKKEADYYKEQYLALKELHNALLHDKEAPKNTQQGHLEGGESKYEIIRFPHDDFIVKKLEDELAAYKAYITNEINSYSNVTNQIISQLTQIITADKAITLQIYGSFATGLCLPNSDIDFVIDTGKNIEAWEAKQILHSIVPLLIKHTEICCSAELINASTMPVLKMICSPELHSIKIDITVKNSLHKGLECVEIIKEYQKQYPQLNSVILPLKNMLRIAKLNNPYTGGISSYALILMLVDYLQRSGCGERLRSSELLLNFLYGYGNTMIPFKIEPLLPSKVKPDPKIYEVTLSNTPIIYDPLVSGNNVSKSAYYFHIIQVFQL